MARHPQLLAFASALAISLFAIPFRLNLSLTATLDIYAIPVLSQERGGIHTTHFEILVDSNTNQHKFTHPYI